ncbi:hypothetical protein J6590_017421 [Homalodisca vitripennis]|nr:hypothetical protein J6590_017421 [Homalodisca vitripennis]
MKGLKVGWLNRVGTDITLNEDDSNQMIRGVTLGCSDNRILTILSASWWLSQLPVNMAVKDTLKISQEQLEQMTESSATKLALSSSEVRLYTDQSPVLQTRLKIYPGLCAVVDLSVDHTKLQFDKEHHKKKRKQARKKGVNK